MKHILLIEDETDHADLIRRALAQRHAAVPDFPRGNSGGGPRAGRRRTCRIWRWWITACPTAAAMNLSRWAADRFPVILLTAFGNERTAVEAIKAGALDYVIKSPEMFADMAHLVERALRDWKNLHERKQAESRLEAINHLLATMGPNFAENVSRLITLLAREIRRAVRLLQPGQRANGSAPSPQWHVETIWRIACAAVARPAPRRSITPPASCSTSTRPAPIRSRTPSRLRVSETHAHLGHIVECHQQPVGILCLFFNRPYQPTEADRRLLGIFAAALGGEENRKRTDAELRASDERYRQIVQTANEGIWVTDEQDRITFANQRLARMLGYTPGGIVATARARFH